MKRTHNHMLRFVEPNEDGEPYFRVEDFFETMADNTLWPVDSQHVNIMHNVLTSVFHDCTYMDLVVSMAHMVGDFYCASVAYMPPGSPPGTLAEDFAIFMFSIVNTRVTKLSKPMLTHHKEMHERHIAASLLGKYSIFFSEGPLDSLDIIDPSLLPNAQMRPILH